MYKVNVSYIIDKQITGDPVRVLRYRLSSKSFSNIALVLSFRMSVSSVLRIFSFSRDRMTDPPWITSCLRPSILGFGSLLSP